MSTTATAIKGGNFKSLGPFAAFIVVGKINAMNHRKSARQGRKAWEKLKLNRKDTCHFAKGRSPGTSIRTSLYLLCEVHYY